MTSDLKYEEGNFFEKLFRISKDSLVYTAAG